MNACSHPTSHPPFITRHRHLLLLAAIAVGLGGDALAAERSEPPPDSKVVTDEGESPPDDLDSGGPDSSDPDPGVPDDQRPDDLCIEREPLDPADDFWWEEPFERPDGADDLGTDASEGEFWLTAADPNRSGAYMTGDRVWHWDANPADPIWQFRVDPSRPIELNAKLELHLRTQPGYDYDIYFWFGGGADMNGSSVQIHNYQIDAHPTIPPVGTGWTALSGPPRGSDPVNHIVSLGIYDLPEEGEARWSVTAVQVVSTPQR